MVEAEEGGEWKVRKVKRQVNLEEVADALVLPPGLEVKGGILLGPPMPTRFFHHEDGPVGLFVDTSQGLPIGKHIKSVKPHMMGQSFMPYIMVRREPDMPLCDVAARDIADFTPQEVQFAAHAAEGWATSLIVRDEYDDATAVTDGLLIPLVTRIHEINGTTARPYWVAAPKILELAPIPGVPTITYPVETVLLQNNAEDAIQTLGRLGPEDSIRLMRLMTEAHSRNMLDPNTTRVFIHGLIQARKHSSSET